MASRSAPTAAPRLRAPRFLRPALAPRLARAGAAAAALLLAACGGDDSTGPRTGRGTYAMTRINGQAVPVSGDIQGTPVTINGGTLELGADQFTFRVEVRANGQTVTATDRGTVTRDGANLTFSSTDSDDEFAGQLSNSNRALAIEYDLDGDRDPEVIEFERR